MQDTKEAMQPLLDAIDKINIHDDADDTDLEVVFEKGNESTDDLLGIDGNADDTRSSNEAPEESYEEDRPKRQGKRFHPSISTRERKRLQQAQAALNQTMQENQELREHLIRERQGSVNYYSQALELQKEGAKKELTRAIEDGDSSAQAEWSDFLSKVNNKIEDAKGGKYSEVNLPPQQSHQYYQEQEVNEEISTPAAAQWYEENRDWLDTDSRFYDPEIIQFADNEFNRIKRQLVLAGYGDLVGTEHFYKGLTESIQDRFGMQNDPVQHEPPPQPRAKSRQPVAPVSYSGMNEPQRGANGKRQISLSPEQRDVAERMIIQGPNGRELSKQEKCVLYARQLMKLEGR